ncbi:MAG: LysE family transporter [Fibrobacter sp.]|nr:LysE family transporter [Fibrobacter sp.]
MFETSYFFFFGTTLLISFSGALMPGPLLSVTINESTREKGWLSGPLLIFGHAILELILIAAIFLGLAPVLNHPAFFVITGIAGSGFMIWMAIGMFKSLPFLSIKAQTTEKKHFLPLSGALMSLANPYWTIWWATIGLGYIIGASELGIKGIVVFFTGHIMADFLWYSFVSTAVYKGRSVLPDMAYRLLIGLCGCFLIVYSVILIFKSIITIFQ